MNYDTLHWQAADQLPSETTDCLPYRRPQPNAGVRLICFHYAGGNASIFRVWQDKFGPDIEVCAVELPGHGMRFSEPLIDAIEPIIDYLDRVLSPLCDAPFAVFGHSMGALLGYIWLSRIHERNGSQPRCFIPAGRLAPHLQSGKPHVDTMDTAALIERVRELNATPDDILDNPEFVDAFLPIIRADFRVNDSYTPTPCILGCPIHALGGATDPEAPVTQLGRWAELTNLDMTQTNFADGHFFVQTQEDGVIAKLRKILLAHK